ncbi:hypothetical protein QBC39DRAFT_109362 [Podospora conica]|nr:hypothetical protein QBC39DRAFT_109362 [Schizothecium conicum]
MDPIKSAHPSDRSQHPKPSHAGRPPEPDVAEPPKFPKSNRHKPPDKSFEMPLHSKVLKSGADVLSSSRSEEQTNWQRHFDPPFHSSAEIRRNDPGEIRRNDPPGEIRRNAPGEKRRNDTGEKRRNDPAEIRRNHPGEIRRDDLGEIRRNTETRGNGPAELRRSNPPTEPAKAFPKTVFTKKPVRLTTMAVGGAGTGTLNSRTPKESTKNSTTSDKEGEEEEEEEQEKKQQTRTYASTSFHNKFSKRPPGPRK